MRSTPLRQRAVTRHDDSDEWLIDAARRAGHRTPSSDSVGRVSAWRLLLGAGVSDDEILRIACAASGADAADLSQVSPALRSLLPHEAALEHRVAPVGVDRGVLAIATVNPRSAALERMLAFASKRRVALQAASPSAILRAQSIVYGSETYGATFNFEAKPASPPPTAVQPRRTPMARISVALPGPVEPSVDPKNSPEALVERVLTTAVAERASEIHIDAVTEGAIVRFRIDGKLNDRFRTSAVHATRLLQQLRAMAKVESHLVGEQRGRTSWTGVTGRVDLRIASEILSGAHERMIVRLFGVNDVLALDALSRALPPGLDDLLAATRGILWVAAPSGSGRTTSLYALAHELRRRGRRIATIEDTVVFQLEGIRQIDANDPVFFTTAAAARSTLALEAGAVIVDLPGDRTALETVLSTDVPRLVVASVDASLLADVVGPQTIGMITQRLVRRLCDGCAVPQPPGDLPDSQQSLLAGWPTTGLRQAVGCERCRGTGFAGRTAVMALAHPGRDSAIPTPWDSGLRHVVDGTTTIGELLDVMSPPQPRGTAAVQQDDIDALLGQLLGRPSER